MKNIKNKVRSENTVDYIDKKEFAEKIKQYKFNLDNNLEDRKLSNYIGISILNLIDKIASRNNFKNYTYLDEMKEEAIIKVFSAMKNLDINRQNFNPFAYFSEITFRCFVYEINKHNNKGEFLSNNILILQQLDNKKRYVVNE